MEAEKQYQFPQFLTLEQVAELLHIPLSKVRQLIRRRILWPVVTISERARVVPVTTLEKTILVMMEERDDGTTRIARVQPRRAVGEFGSAQGRRRRG